MNNEVFRVPMIHGSLGATFLEEQLFLTILPIIDNNPIKYVVTANP